MLSVIVTCCDTPELLERCLAALVRQPAAAEIIVADCSFEDPTARVRAAFPQVRVRRVERMAVPALRWTAAREVRGDVIAAVEARCTPAADWCDEIERAHRRWADAPAVGGPVDLKSPASAFDWGLYLSEYVAFAPPVVEGESEQLSSANLSYKRADLDRARDLLDQGVWEAALHERWRREGRALRMSSATVTFQNGLTPGAALALRFHYARAYAAERVGADMARALFYGMGTPLLPALLTWRIARAAHAKGRPRAFWRALPWTLAFVLAWAAGELAGYVAGRPPRPRIF